MTQAVKYYIEQNKSKIENNDLHLVYFYCPLHMLKELVEVLSIAGITYPPQLHNYVTVCCYMTDLFSNNICLEEIEYQSDYNEFRFTTVSLQRINYELVRLELFELIPSCIDFAVQIDWSGSKLIEIKIRNDTTC